MLKLELLVDMNIPEVCTDCRFRVNGACLLDDTFRIVESSWRPYWCKLNKAKLTERY